MKKSLWLVWGLTVGCLGVFAPRSAFSQETTPVVNPASGSMSSQEMELEKLRLEKEKLELEVEKLKLQATLGPSTETKKEKPSKADKKELLEKFQSDYSAQAQTLAQQHKDEADLMVLDLVNSEIWYKGTRYGIHEWESLAGNQGWKLSKRVDSRDSGGHARYLYRYLNNSLLRYEGRNRGVWTFQAPSKDGDFRFLTPEGLSFTSLQEDVRNAFKNDYFEFERQKRDKHGMLLRYVHKVNWQFDDKLEVSFGLDGKMSGLRYGVLDER